MWPEGAGEVGDRGSLDWLLVNHMEMGTDGLLRSSQEFHVGI